MSVHIGHLHDPLSVPGCAHFLEHMLFLGTEAFPDEQEYKRYLRNHDGGCNASTGPEQTNYFFYVHPSGLEGALDRFAAFFTCPLLASDSASREMKAVDSEFRRNLTSDPRRRYQLSKFLCREGHPFRRFGTGNLASLQPALSRADGPSIEAVLRDFHTKYYDARSMRFVLVGREPLPQLRAMAEDRFGGVPRQVDHQPKPTIRRAGLPWTPAELGRLVVAEPLKDSRDLQLTWPVPTRSWPDTSNPGWYVSHLLGHEGPGSLLASLKRAGWASRLSAGTSANQAFAQFQMSISLTPDGLANWEAVVGMTFAYVDMVAGPASQPRPVESWRWDEAAATQAQRLRFQDKQSAPALARATARKLHYFPPERVLTEPSLLGPVDEGGIRALLHCLHPRNLNITLSAKELSGPSAFAAVVDDVGPRVEAAADAAAGAADGHTIADAAFKADPGCPLRQFEPWYGTRFDAFRFNARQLALWGDASPEEPLPLAWSAEPWFAPERRALRSEALARHRCAEWALPPANAYIAERFDVLATQWTEEEKAARMQPEASAADLRAAGSLIDVAAARQPAPQRLPLPTGAEGLHLVWSAPDARFGKPKASLLGDFHFGGAHALRVQPPHQRLRALPEELAQRGLSLAADLALLAISEAELVPRFYDADLAGVSAQTHCSLGALHVQARGWTDKLGSMLTDYSAALRGGLDATAAGRCSPAVLAAYARECERTERRFLDALRCSAAGAAAKAAAEVLSSGSIGVWERLELLRAAPPARAGAAAVAEALATSSLEMLAQGNVGSDTDVLAAAQSMRSGLGAGAAASAAELERELQQRQARELRLPRAAELPGPAAGVLVERMHCHPEDVNCAVSVVLQLGLASDRTVALGQLLAKLLGQPFFAQLRTREQLGYSVRLSHRVARGASALQLDVQSASHSAPHALERILHFLAVARGHLLEPAGAADEPADPSAAPVAAAALAGISDPALRRMQESMADDAVQADRSRGQELRRMASELDRGRWRFGKLAGIADHLLAASREDLLRFFDDRVAVGGAETRLLAVLVHSQLRAPEGEPQPPAVDGEAGAAFRNERRAAAAARELEGHRAALDALPLRQVGEWSLLQASGMSGMELQAAVHASATLGGPDAASGEWRGFWQNWREQRERD